jgi:uncharacterized membrane protein
MKMHDPSYKKNGTNLFNLFSCLFIYVAWKQAVGLSGGTVVTLCHALIMGSSQVTWKAVPYSYRYNLRFQTNVR